MSYKNSCVYFDALSRQNFSFIVPPNRALRIENVKMVKPVLETLQVKLVIGTLQVKSVLGTLQVKPVLKTLNDNF